MRNGNSASDAIQVELPRQWLAASTGLRQIAFLGLCFLGSGCSLAQPTPSGADQPSLQVPDPSVALCLENGHQLAPMRKAGIIQSYLCINPETGLKCDSWAYYRGECSSERQQPQRKPPVPEQGPAPGGNANPSA